MSLGIGTAPPDGSVVAVGSGDKAVLVLGNGGKFRQTIGLNPHDGSTRWVLPGIGGGNIGLPGRWQHEGRELLLLTGNDQRDTEGVLNTLFAIDPENGEMIWSDPLLGLSSGPILVQDGIGLGMAATAEELEGSGKKRGQLEHLGAVRLDESGAQLLWRQPQAQMGYRRTMNVLHDGIFYAHTIGHGLTATDVQSGNYLAIIVRQVA